MTEMQILRKVLFEEIEKTRNGTADLVNTRVLIAASNAITQTYNTELKACEVMIKSQETGANLKGVEVNIFKEDDKKVIDYKAKDEDL